MERHVLWQPWTDPGFEHLLLRSDAGEIVADGVVTRVTPAVRIHYEIRCDPGYRVRAVSVRSLDPGGRSLRLLADGAGNWRDEAGGVLDALKDCLDVDISATPFTNTLPIRRLELSPGQSAELAMAYVSVLEVSVSMVRQRYTCLELGAGGGRYRYEGLSTGFTAELPVDPDGLVLDYPGVWRRVWPR
jgi:hypothetical protein